MSKIKDAQSLLIFGTSNISSMLHSILMLKVIFIKYLPPVRPKKVPKLKSVQNLLKFSTFNISNIVISILMSKIIFMKYVIPVRPKLVPKLKMFRIY